MVNPYHGGEHAIGDVTARHSLAEWLGWLETLSPNEIDLGLERVNEVLQRLALGRPQRVLHVAGTNGKGSSVAMLEALYLQQGESVGCYTSPHMRCYNERIRVAGKAVSDARIVAALQQVEAARHDVPLTYFEYGTLAALCVFEFRSVDTVILEVGMGGRLDAVNAVDPDGGIITNVSFDHADWLGDDIEAIAAEKAGILRHGKPFVFAADDLPDSVARKADASGARLSLLDRDYRYRSIDDQTWQFTGRSGRRTELQPPALAGDFQLQNAAGVLALVEALGDMQLLDKEIINRAFATLALPGRFQLIERQRRWVLDVAHNAGAACALACALENQAAAEKSICIIGVLADKQVEDIVTPLLPLVDVWIAVPVASARAIPAAELARIISNLSGRPCRIADSVANACEAIDVRSEFGHPVLVTGSFFTVAPVLEWLRENPRAPNGNR